MSLEKWVEYGWLRKEPTSPGEIKDLLGIVERSLADSKVEVVSTDLRQAGAEFSSTTLFPSRPLDTNPTLVFAAGSVIRDQGALARVA